MAAKNDTDMKYRQNRQQTFEQPVKVAGISKPVSWAESHAEELRDPLIDSGFYYSPIKSNLNRVMCSYCKKPETVVDEADVTILPARHYEKNKKCSLSLVLVTSLARDQHKSRDSIVHYWNSHEQRIIRHPLSQESRKFRLESFGTNYPLDKLKGFRPTSKSLSEAGFVYSPVDYADDRVVCIYCGCSLDQWEAEDDPIEQHVENSKLCYFLDQFKQDQHEKHKSGEGKSRRKPAKARSKLHSRQKNVFVGLFSDEAEVNDFNETEGVDENEDGHVYEPSEVESPIAEKSIDKSVVDVQKREMAEIISVHDTEEVEYESSEEVEVAKSKLSTVHGSSSERFSVKSTRPEPADDIELDAELDESGSDLNDEDFAVDVKNDNEPQVQSQNNEEELDSIPLRRSARVRKLKEQKHSRDTIQVEPSSANNSSMNDSFSEDDFNMIDDVNDESDDDMDEDVYEDVDEEDAKRKDMGKNRKKDPKPTKNNKKGSIKSNKSIEIPPISNSHPEKNGSESPSKSKKLRLFRRSFSPAVPIFVESDEEIDELIDEKYTTSEKTVEQNIKIEASNIRSKANPMKNSRIPAKGRELNGIVGVTKVAPRPFRKRNEPSIFDTSLDDDSVNPPKVTSRTALSIRNLPVPKPKSTNKSNRKRIPSATTIPQKKVSDVPDEAPLKKVKDIVNVRQEAVDEEEKGRIEADDMYIDASEGNPEVEIEDDKNSHGNEIKINSDSEAKVKQDMVKEDISHSKSDEINRSKRESFKAQPYFTFDEDAELDKDVDLTNIVQDISDINKEIAKRMKVLFVTAERKKLLESTEISRNRDSESNNIDSHSNSTATANLSGRSAIDSKNVKILDRGRKDKAVAGNKNINASEEFRIDPHIKHIIESEIEGQEVNSSLQFSEEVSIDSGSSEEETSTRSETNTVTVDNMPFPELTRDDTENGVSIENEGNRYKSAELNADVVEDSVMEEISKTENRVELKATSSPTHGNTTTGVDNSKGTVAASRNIIEQEQDNHIQNGKSDGGEVEELMSSKTEKEPTGDVSVMDGISGNFSDLSSSTPQKAVPSGRDVTRIDNEWVPSSLASFIERLNIIRDAVDEFSELASSDHDLVDDPGSLTRFIAEMPENEKDMTIKEWMDDAASICRGLVLELCGDMNEHLVQDYRRAIAKVGAIGAKRAQSTGQSQVIDL